MHLRRVFAIIISSFFIGVTLFTSVALADDGSVSISNIRVSPSILPGAGQVTVMVNVAVDINRAEGGINNVYIDGSGVVTPAPVVGGIQVAENQDVSCTLNVQGSQLGDDVPLTVKWDGGSASFSVKVNSSAPTVPQVVLTRSIDKTTVEKGGAIVLTYRVENTGSIDITNLTITDSGINSDALRTKDFLVAGASFEFTCTYTVNADFTSVPKLTYMAGSATYTSTCPAKTVLLKVAQLDVLLESSPDTVASGGEVVLQCTVTNSGNVKLSNVVVSENALGKKLFPEFAIEAGAPPKYFTRNIALTQTTKFQFVLTAKDDSGSTYTFKSNEIEVAVSSVQYDLGFTVTADAFRLSEPGDVNFTFSINNKDTAPVAGASIVDQDGAVVKEFDSLPVGQTPYTYTVVADKTKQFNFCLVVPNADGTNFQVFTGPVEIEVADAAATLPATLQPTDQPSPSGAETTAASGSSGGLGKMSSLITALLVVGVLIAFTIIVLIAMIISDKKRHKR
jgi:hypothetical protein